MDQVALEQVQAVLSTTAARWRELTRAVPRSLLERAPEPGEWSALQCLQHLLDTEEWVFPPRLRALLAGQDFPAFDPDAQGRTPDVTLTPADVADRFAELRADGLRELARVTVADLERTGRHSELGVVSMADMLNEWAGHDLMHTVQAERALMQPFIVGAGPWRSYFAAHDVGETRR